jgi:hypothetical protein
MLMSVVLACAVALTARPLPEQRTSPPSADQQYLGAVEAWEAGRYPDALRDLRALLQSPAAADYLDRAAVLTGELFVTTEITADGRNPGISADGSTVAYETGAGAATRTVIVRVGEATTRLAELAATGVILDGTGARAAWLRQATPGDPAATELVVRDLAGGAEAVWLGPGLLKSSIAWASDNRSLLFLGGNVAEPDRSDIYRVSAGEPPVRLTAEGGHKSSPVYDSRGATLVYTVAAQSPFGGRGGGGRGGGGRGGGRGGGGAPPTYAVVSLATGGSTTVAASALALSTDGSTIAWLVRGADGSTALNVGPAASAAPTLVRTVPAGESISTLVLSPDGSLVAYQLMTHVDWEIHVSDRSGTHRRITRDIQHDLQPRFLSNTMLLGLKGESRHRRAHLYDLETGAGPRLFSNNSLRTVSPEYAWIPSEDSRRIVIQADRDGDTISAERSLSVVDLTRKVTVADVLGRIDRQLADENDLRQRMTTAFAPVADTVRQVLGLAALNRVYTHERELGAFDSKHITRPGNLKAIEYLERTYRSYGYEPELQWFTPTALQASGGRTANVVATLRGTEHPDLIYVVGSHFDSVAAGPGADDNTSGTAALLEAARMLARTPLPATVVFASFTGEEAGLLGSREFVRVAAERKWNVLGALNNDMIGYSADKGRMDNTIRYSNAGIRDIQHGASFLFTDLVLYDAKYYRSTDAHAFYDGWGDIVGGIGSYPILANPNYHQSTDFIETMDFQQILETAKVTAATLVHLASSPSRLKDVKAGRAGGGTEVTWTASPETGIRSYIVAYGPAGDPLRTRLTVTTSRATLPALPAGTHVAVKAVNTRGLEGWDWARVVIQ